MTTYYTTDKAGVYLATIELGHQDKIPAGTDIQPPSQGNYQRWDGVQWSTLEYYPGTSPSDILENLNKAKLEKIQQINLWRATANQTYFTHQGKQIACDQLSRSDIDAVAANISLTGTFPAGFPGAWKAMDNSYIMLPNIAAFKAMYESMTLQGTTNFGQSQALKTQLAAATTLEQINDIIWIS